MRKRYYIEVLSSNDQVLYDAYIFFSSAREAESYALRMKKKYKGYVANATLA